MAIDRLCFVTACLSTVSHSLLLLSASFHPKTRVKLRIATWF